MIDDIPIGLTWRTRPVSWWPTLLKTGLPPWRAVAAIHRLSPQRQVPSRPRTRPHDQDRSWIGEHFFSAKTTFLRHSLLRSPKCDRRSAPTWRWGQSDRYVTPPKKCTWAITAQPCIASVSSFQGSHSYNEVRTKKWGGEIPSFCWMVLIHWCLIKRRLLFSRRWCFRR
jgi:hypothetical protein